MSLFPPFAKPLNRAPALIGDGQGNVRVPSFDLVWFRHDDGTGRDGIAVLGRAEFSSNAAEPYDDAYLPADGTPITLVYGGGLLPHVDTHLLP